MDIFINNHKYKANVEYIYPTENLSIFNIEINNNFLVLMLDHLSITNSNLIESISMKMSKSQEVQLLPVKITKMLNNFSNNWKFVTNVTFCLSNSNNFSSTAKIRKIKKEDILEWKLLLNSLKDKEYETTYLCIMQFGN